MNMVRKKNPSPKLYHGSVMKSVMEGFPEAKVVPLGLGLGFMPFSRVF